MLIWSFQELSIERLLEMESLVADPSEEFQFLRVGPESNVPPRYRAPVSSLCQIGEFTVNFTNDTYCIDVFVNV